MGSSRSASLSSVLSSLPSVGSTVRRGRRRLRWRSAVAVLGLVVVLAGLSSCGSGAGDGDGEGTVTAATGGEGVGTPNPASVYCEEQGGTSEIVTAADGSQSGICRLPDGTEVDEWEFFRASQASTTAVTGTTGATVTTGTTGSAEGPVDYDLYLLAPGDACDEVVAVPRTSTVEGAPAEALALLLAGPTAEDEAAGRHSWFSAATAGMLQAVVVEDGTANVSFAPELATTIPNASTSCGSAGLLAQLDATVLQFDGIERVVYSFDGDVDAFYYWLQLVSPDS